MDTPLTSLDSSRSALHAEEVLHSRLGVLAPALATCDTLTALCLSGACFSFSGAQWVVQLVQCVPLSVPTYCCGLPTNERPTTNPTTNNHRV